MKTAEKIYTMYEDYGLRIGVIAERLGMKPTTVSVTLANYRRSIGEPPRAELQRQKKAKTRLVGFAGSDRTDTWVPIAKPAGKVLKGLRK